MQRELNIADDSIINNPDKFTLNAVTYFLLAFFLNGANALGFVINLVADRDSTEHPPSRAVVARLGDENRFAFLNYVVVLVFGSVVFGHEVLKKFIRLL